MYNPVFRLKSFETISDVKKFGVMRFLLEALTMSNIAYLLDNPQTPDLYRSGVHYLEEPPGRDEWQDIPDTLERGNGDCEDLACWRVAELRVKYGQRRARRGISVSRLPRGGLLYHIMVLHENGAVEDPSRILGMNHDAPGAAPWDGWPGTANAPGLPGSQYDPASEQARAAGYPPPPPPPPWAYGRGPDARPHSPYPLF